MKWSALSILIFLQFSQLKGQYAVETETRSIASVRLRSLEIERLGSGHICTATLISSWHVVTAATCVHHLMFSEIIVVMGVTNISLRSNQAVTRDVRLMFFHPNFERIDHFNGNLAVLVFTMSIREATSWWAIIRYSVYRNFHVRPIELDDRRIDGATCKVLGWGHGENGEINPHLLSRSVSINNNGNSVICAQDTVLCSENAALCGNLGSTLVCDNRFSGFVITNACNGTEYYHSVAHYREWIYEVTSGAAMLKPFMLAPILIAVFMRTVK